MAVSAPFQPHMDILEKLILSPDGIASPMKHPAPPPSAKPSPVLSVVEEDPFPALVEKLNSLANELNSIHQRIVVKTNEILNKVRHDLSSSRSSYRAIMFHNPVIVPHLTSCNNLLKYAVDLFLSSNFKSKWNHQQKCEIGSFLNEPPINLSQLSIPCKKIFHSVIEILQKIHSVNPSNYIETTKGKDVLTSLFNQCLEHLQMFLNETFIIKQQPPLAISSDEVFPTSVCLLSGPIPNVINPGEQAVVQVGHVEAFLIDKGQMRTLIDEGIEKLDMTKKLSPTCTGLPKRLEKGIAALEASEEGFLVAKLPDANLAFGNNVKIGKDTDCKDTDNRKKTSVFEDKHSLLFTLRLEVFGEIFDLWTSFLPIGVPSALSRQVNENRFGFTLMIKENVTSPTIQTLLDTSPPEVISWTQLSKAILNLFRKTLQDDNLKFSDDQLDCIKGKIDYALLKAPNIASFEEIKWSALNSKVFSQGCSKYFSFLDWLSNALRSIKSKDMVKLWKKGYILGFVERHRAEELLRQNGINGTFLLRFSDRLPGNISVVVYQQDKVCHLTPVKANDLGALLKVKEVRNFSLSYIYGFGRTPKDELLEPIFEDILPGYV